MSYVPHPGAAAVRSPAEIATAADLSAEAKALLGDGIAPREYAEALAAAGLVADAVTFLAHAMPRREAVWWGWACARRAAGDQPRPAIKASLDATERWIAQPTEEHRRAAAAAAERAEFGTSAGCAGLGAFFSGGSIAPPGLPDALPDEFMTAKAVAGAVSLASVEGPAAEAETRLAEFLQQGMAVAERINLWTGAR